jgi:hypothetical protein
MPIEIKSDVFDTSGGDGEANEHVIIVGAADPQAAGNALGHAGQRFYRVTEHGDELTAAQMDEDGGDAYTPNYVSDTRLATRGPWCYVDCQGEISPMMRDRLLAILAQELEREGVAECRVEVASDEEIDYDAPVLFEQG